MGVTSLSRDGIAVGEKYASALAGNSIYDVSAMEPIASAVGSSTGVNFISIPQVYQDLFIVASVRTLAATTISEQFDWRLNNDSGSNYSYTTLEGNGSSASSYRANNQTVGMRNYVPGNNATAGIMGSMVLHVLNYANTSTNKVIISRAASDVNGSGYTQLSVGLWRNTAAINRIDLFTEAGTNLNGATTFTLYGIRAVR
jgi:hypothetical protein